MIFRSSGSSGKTRVKHYYSWDNWLELLIGMSRSFIAHGIDESHTLMTTDVGNSQIGYRLVEDSASFLCSAKVIKSGGTTWSDKIQMIQEFGVTVFCATTTKLKRIGALIKNKDQVKSLKLIIQIGEPMSSQDCQLIKDLYGVNTVLDSYGCVEAGQISFNCSAGNIHVHEDLVHVVNIQGNSYATKLVSLPIFNVLSPEILQYSYKGKCDCGSFLATVDKFCPRQTTINRKE
jgi:phenylacetate-coenzyme A ligase PaaK-like adenylate-forming protein